MLYLLKNQLNNFSNRNRNRYNVFFTEKESEHMPEKGCFMGQIDVEYESDEDAYKNYMDMQKKHHAFIYD